MSPVGPIAPFSGYTRSDRNSSSASFERGKRLNGKSSPNADSFVRKPHITIIPARTKIVLDTPCAFGNNPLSVEVIEHDLSPDGYMSEGGAARGDVVEGSRGEYKHGDFIRMIAAAARSTAKPSSRVVAIASSSDRPYLTDFRISKLGSLSFVDGKPLISWHVRNGDPRKFECFSKLRRARIGEDLVERFSDDGCISLAGRG